MGATRKSDYTDPATMQKWVRLHEQQGLNFATIAKRFGVGVNVVSKHVRAAQAAKGGA